MGYIHVHAPESTQRSLCRALCPTCNKRRWFVSWFVPWYGWSQTCLKCGDRWEDGEMTDRPFMRAWRTKSIAHVKARWRAENKLQTKGAQ